LNIGDQFKVEAAGPGCLRVTRVDEIAAGYADELGV